MSQPVYVDLIYRGMDATSPAEQESIARELAVEFQVGVAETRRLLEHVDSPLRAGLAPAAAERLAERLRAMGLRVELVAAAPGEEPPPRAAAMLDLRIPCRRCGRRNPVEVAACPNCGTAVDAGHPAGRELWSDLPPAVRPAPLTRRAMLLRMAPLVLILAVGIGAWALQARRPPPSPPGLETAAPEPPPPEAFVGDTRELQRALGGLAAAATPRGSQADYERRLAGAQGLAQNYLARWPGAPHPLDPTTADQLRLQLRRALAAHGDARDLWRMHKTRPQLALTDPDVAALLARYPGLRAHSYHPRHAPVGIDYLRPPDDLQPMWQDAATATTQLDKIVAAALGR